MNLHLKPGQIRLQNGKGTAPYSAFRVTSCARDSGRLPLNWLFERSKTVRRLRFPTLAFSSPATTSPVMFLSTAEGRGDQICQKMQTSAIFKAPHFEGREGYLHLCDPGRNLDATHEPVPRDRQARIAGRIDEVFEAFGEICDRRS